MQEPPNPHALPSGWSEIEPFGTLVVGQAEIGREGSFAVLPLNDPVDAVSVANWLRNDYFVGSSGIHRGATLIGSFAVVYGGYHFIVFPR